MNHELVILYVSSTRVRNYATKIYICKIMVYMRYAYVLYATLLVILLVKHLSACYTGYTKKNTNGDMKSM